MRNVPQDNNTGKGQTRHPLSSGAYFTAKYETTHSPRQVSPEYTSQRNMQRVKSAQQRRLRHEKPVKITTYADMITVKYPDELNGRSDRRTDFAGGGIRGEIVGLSRASRKRMIEFMAKVRDTGDMYFVTMTYDDMSWLTKHDDHHSDFEAFRKRFERAFQNFKAIWRVEVKERKSGILQGQRVPHFHLLVFTGRRDDNETKEAHAMGLQAWGVSAWGEILQTANPHFENYGFHVSIVRSRKHAYSYVSKYIGKVDDDDICCGRRWGRIGKFDCSASETFVLTDDEALELRRIIKRWLRGRNKKFSKRFCRMPAFLGYSVFGCGDTPTDGTTIELMYPAYQFISAAKSYVAERGARERSYGD